MDIFRIWGFFPTPRSLAKELISKIEIKPGALVLEPSAGRGDLAAVIQEMHPDARVRVIEQNTAFAPYLRARKMKGKIMNFFDWKSPIFDAIIANPPFGEGFIDIDHFMHAWELLKPGGRLSFILHEYSAFPQKGYGKPIEFLRFLDKIGGHKQLNPPGSFASAARPTMTGTSMVWAEKPFLIPFGNSSRKEEAYVQRRNSVLV